MGLLDLAMKGWLWFLFWSVKLLVSIRYRVHVRGIGAITPEALPKKGGILFLPNHPAEIDPILLVLVLWKKFRPRPIVVENFYYLKGAHYFQRIIGALPMPDLGGTVNKWKQKQVEKLFHHVSSRLGEGENYLIYPSGRLKHTGEEALGGASFVHNLLQECPDANVVLIRTTGLWGSRFSRAITGVTPNFGKVLWEGFKVVLKNGLFLTPRRDVVIDLELAPATLPVSSSRLDFNQYLEKWYNISGPEPIKLVSDVFWGKRYPEITASKKEETKELEVSIPPELEQELLSKLGEIARRSPSLISRSMHLSRDLGLDSLDLAQLAVFLEEKYEIEGLIVGSLLTVEDVFTAAVRKPEADSEKESKAPPLARWPHETARPSIGAPLGVTIQEAFLRICDKMDGYVACADATYGVMSYRRMKLAALLLSRKIAAFDEKHIGVLLPSSAGAYIVIFAILLAKKIPVMLNWTVGTRALAHCAETVKLRHVLSSRRFLSNLNNGDLGPIDDLLVLLEDVREEISLGQKLRALYSLLKDADSLLQDLGLFDVPPNDPAVILFTSGTETLPKGVPLSHANLLTNQAAALSCVDFKNSDILYGVLPPFHSFGFSVTGLMPILAGMRVYYAPDPTDGHAMARDIAAWKATLFCCAPTFIRGLFRTAKPEDLKSLRYIVSGAEKTPQDLFDYVEKLGRQCELIEGYGITECAPIVSICRPGKPRIGVGLPIPGIELCVLSETEERLPQGQEGEICIHGPNVFYGYLGMQKSPFITFEGKQWYRSGDRGFIDPQGHIVLSGRLKRFVKVGGEMISLGGLEEELLELASEKNWSSTPPPEGPILAIGVAERESQRPLIVMFATFEISKEDVNAALRDCGYGKIVKITEVRKLPQIPITGTGKIHYRALDEMLC